jgi:hypothetical protein
MRITWALIGALGLALAGRVSAAPSFFGPTGDLVIPTADTLAQNSWNAHVHALDASGNTETTFGVNYGLAKQLEVGITGFHVRGIGTKALFNAKYTVLPEKAKVPGIALGGLDMAAQIGSDPGIYVVASKSLSSLLGANGPLAKYNLRGHLGYGAKSVFNDDIFGGVDVQITPKIQAMAEWLNGDLFAGGRFGISSGVRAELGSYDGHIGGGISYAAALK